MTIYRLTASLSATTTVVREQIMGQDLNSSVFNATYLNLEVRFDIQATFLERPSIGGLTKALTHMSRCLITTSVGTKSGTFYSIEKSAMLCSHAPLLEHCDG